MGSQRFLPCLHCLLMLVPLVPGADSAYTYARRPGSYAEYDRWSTTQDGLATFNFKTSQADALLFYLDSSGNGGNYLVVWLEDGRMNARIKVGSGQEAPLLETTFGLHLNDLRQHSLLIKHSRGTFEFYLNTEKAGELRYNVKHLFQTLSQVYIGGLPTSYVPDYEAASEMQPLAGCVDGVRFADASPNIIELRPREPSATNELQEGCSDGCADDAQCNGGRCVQNWSRPDGFFCDCSSADNVGEFCTDPSSEHRLVLAGDGYVCYTLAPEPFTPEHDDIAVQLQSPLPASGTVVTGESRNLSDSFNLFLEGRILRYELTIGGNTFPTKSARQLSASRNYRISVARSESEIVITIQTVSSTNQVTVAETIEMPLPPSTPEPVFQFFCVGGGTLETQLYNGVMERIVIGHTALIGTQTSTRHTPGDFISFRSSPPSPSLAFPKHGFSFDEVSFQFRLAPDTETGVILKAGNQAFELTLTIFNSFEGNEILLVAGHPVVCEMNVVDNRWHLLELRKTETAGRRGIVVTFDRNASTSCQVDISQENLDILESNSSILELGPTTTSVIIPGNPTPFEGCFQKIRFTTGSDVFRPNLEVPIMLYGRFYGDGCRDCQPEYEETYCKRTNGVCRSNGFGNISCECLEPYIGPTCECLGPSIGPACKDLTDPPTVPSPSSSSPSSKVSTPLTTPTDPTVSGNKGNNGDGTDYDTLGQWVGIGTAILLVLILLSIMMVFMGCFVYSQRIKRVGFYRTHENTPSVSLPHFSASLKTAHSHTLNLEQNRVTAITNGRTVHPTYASGEKEFYI